MSIFNIARGMVVGRKAYKTYVDAVKLADDDQPEAAKEKYRSAIKQYAEAERLGNRTPNAMLVYALLLMREGEFDEARRIMVDVSKLPGLPDNSRFQLRIQYSILQWSQGNVSDAIATIRRAAAMKMNGSIYSTLGMYLVDLARETGDFEEAIRFNQEALDYDDEDAATLDNMGQLYELLSEDAQSKGDFENAESLRSKAKGFFEKAHERRPRQITTIYYLARMLHREGLQDQAFGIINRSQKLYYSAICPITRQMMEELKRKIEVAK